MQCQLTVQLSFWECLGSLNIGTNDRCGMEREADLCGLPHESRDDGDAENRSPDLSSPKVAGAPKVRAAGSYGCKTGDQSSGEQSDRQQGAGSIAGLAKGGRLFFNCLHGCLVGELVSSGFSCSGHVLTVLTGSDNIPPPPFDIAVPTTRLNSLRSLYPR